MIKGRRDGLKQIWTRGLSPRVQPVFDASRAVMRAAKRHPVVAAVATLLTCILLAAIVDAVRIRQDLEAGRDQLQHSGAGDIEGPGGIRKVALRASSRISRADDRARHSPVLRLLGATPLVGSQIDAVREMTGGARALGDATVESAAKLDVAIAKAKKRPIERVRLLDTALVELRRLRTLTTTLDVGEGFLVPGLSGARATYRNGLVTARTRFDEAEATASALRTFLAGPGDYLVLAANNAEMTGGSGMPNSGGVAHVENGEIKLSKFYPTQYMFIGFPGVKLPGDLKRLYAKMGIGADVRGTTATPNFPVIAPALARMARRSPMGQVDGVFLIDAFVLARLVGVTGPIKVDDLVLNQKTVALEILNRNYVRFATPAQREARSSLQSDIARAVFDALTTRDVSPSQLAQGITQNARGRHFLAWSADPKLQAVWRSIGATGALRPDGLLISVENYDGNKLDFYLKPHGTLTRRARPDGRDYLTLRVTVANLRGGATRQIQGDDPSKHWVLLDVHLPRAAANISMQLEKGRTLKGVEIGSDPPMKVVNGYYPVPLGESETAIIGFSLPANHPPLTLLPGARVWPLQLAVNDATINDRFPQRFDWREPDPRPRSAPAYAVASAVALLAADAHLLMGVRRRRRLPSMRLARFDDRIALVLVAGALTTLFCGFLFSLIP